MTRHPLARIRLAAVVAVGLSLVAMPAVGTPTPAAAPLDDCVDTDNGDPDLLGFRMSTAAVDVTGAAAEVTFTVDAEDTGGPGPASGIAGGSVYLSGPAFGGAELTEGPAGGWRATITIPRGVASGPAGVTVTLHDRAANQTRWNSSELSTRGFPSALDITGALDRGAPVLTDLTLTPRSADTRTASKRITVTAHVTDDAAGVRSVSVRAAPPPRFAGGLKASLMLVPGTTSTYRGTMTIPRWVTSGRWHIRRVHLGDAVGNTSSWSYDELGDAGFNRGISVVSTRDSARSSLASFSRRPARLDLRSSDGAVLVTARARDLGSGVGGVVVVVWNRAGPFAEKRLHRVSGTVRNGVWRGRVPMSRCGSIPGNWRIDVHMVDRAGHYRTYQSSDLARRRWPSRVAVRALDHVAPSARTAERVAADEDITLHFDEPVNGLDTASAILRWYAHGRDDAGVPGQWTCQDADGAATGCATGAVVSATFDPESTLADPGIYAMELNPDHVLSLTDLAGNPVVPTELRVHVPRD